MIDHLGYSPHEPSGRNSGNSRNGKSHKTVQSTEGELDIEVPRDRNGSFDPQIVRKRQRRLDVLDDKIIALYARGLSTREIQAELTQLYGLYVGTRQVYGTYGTVRNAVRQGCRSGVVRSAHPSSSEPPEPPICFSMLAHRQAVLRGSLGGACG